MRALTILKENKYKILHGLFRLFLFIIFAVFSIILVLFSKKGFISELREGDVASESIYSPIDFNFQGPIDEAKTKQTKDEALKKVLPVYNHLTLALDKNTMSKVISILSEGLKGPHYKSQAVESIYGIVFKNNYFISLEEKRRLLENNVARITIVKGKDGSSKEIQLSDIKTLPEAREEIIKALNKEPFKKKERDSILGLISVNIKPNITFDVEKTNKIKVDAENSVSPIYKHLQVKKNELIIDKGRIVSKDHLNKLKALYSLKDKTQSLPFYIGLSVLIVVFIITTISFLKIYYPKAFCSNKELALLAVLFLLAIIIGKTIEYSPFSSFVVPVASLPMAYMMLSSNAAISFVFAAVLSLVTGISFSNNIGLVIIFFIGSVVGLTAVSRVRRRSQILWAGLLVGIVQFLGLLGWGLFNNLDYYLVLRQSAEWSMGSAVLCAFILMVLLPILESIFGIVTNITLLELSDFNQPLLKEMVLKAPGTYHHSLLVGNLSEAAAESIGANSLLARVGAYFHDIGKIEKPEYFSENQREEESKHETLNPSMSRLVILNHVKEGVDLAHKYKLRGPLIDFITQHHGTSLVYYFYRRALEGHKEEDEIKEEVFRYAGPKPQTKEIAICLLADSVEAATRTIEEPTANKIDDAVRKVINNKFIDGQLDECELTLKDLEKIAKTFTHILTGIYHIRVVYPQDKNVSKYKEQSKQPGDSRRSSKENRK
ncbi:MAG: HDIG domain-containing metalloprotein [Candidatus Omnitrophota bacterium]